MTGIYWIVAAMLAADACLLAHWIYERGFNRGYHAAKLQELRRINRVNGWGARR